VSANKLARGRRRTSMPHRSHTRWASRLCALPKACAPFGVGSAVQDEPMENEHESLYVQYRSPAMLKLQQAARVFQSLERDVDRWNEEHQLLAPMRAPWDGPPRLEIFRPQALEELPFEAWEASFHDGVHNLRVALDTLCIEMCHLEGRRPRNVNKVHFPVTAHPNEWPGRTVYLDSMPAPLLERMRLVQGWARAREDGEPDPLTLIARADNDDKHRATGVTLDVLRPSGARASWSPSWRCPSWRTKVSSRTSQTVSAGYTTRRLGSSTSSHRASGPTPGSSRSSQALSGLRGFRRRFPPPTLRTHRRSSRKCQLADSFDTVASCRAVRGVFPGDRAGFPRCFCVFPRCRRRFPGGPTPRQRRIRASSHGFPGRSPRFLGERPKPALTCDDTRVEAPSKHRAFPALGEHIYGA